MGAQTAKGKPLRKNDHVQMIKSFAAQHFSWPFRGAMTALFRHLVLWVRQLVPHSGGKAREGRKIETDISRTGRHSNCAKQDIGLQ